MRETDASSDTMTAPDGAGRPEAFAEAAADLARDLGERAVWLWSADGKTLLWSNAAGLAALGLPMPAPAAGDGPPKALYALLAEVTPSAPAIRSLQAVARMQADASQRGRIEILRVSAQGHHETVVATCRSVLVAGETVVMALGGASRTSERSPVLEPTQQPPREAARQPDALSDQAVIEDEVVDDAVVGDTVIADDEPAFTLAIAPGDDMGDDDTGNDDTGNDDTGNMSEPEIPPADAEEPPAKPQAPFTFKARSRPHRFSFTVDGHGKVAGLSSGLADAVGMDCALKPGDTAHAAIDRLGIDVPEVVVHSLDERRRFAEQTFLWPVSGHPLAVPVRLSGFDEDDGTLRVFGTVLTGKAQDQATSTSKHGVQDTVAIDINGLNDGPSRDATMAMQVQVPGAAHLASAGDPVPPPSTVIARVTDDTDDTDNEDDTDDASEPLSDAEASAAGLWSEGRPDDRAAATLAPAAARSLAQDDAEAAGLWSPAGPAPMPQALDGTEEVFDASVDGADRHDAAFPEETMKAMKAVAAGVAAGLVGGAATGVAINEDEAPSDTAAITDEPSDTPDEAETAEAETAEAETADPATDAAPDDKPVADADPVAATEPAADDPDLNRPQRLTFQEIARRLGARLGGQEAGAAHEADRGPTDAGAETDRTPSRDPSAHAETPGEPKADGEPATVEPTVKPAGGAVINLVPTGQETDRVVLDDGPPQAKGPSGAASSGTTSSSAARGDEIGGRVVPFTRSEPNAERMVLDRLPLGVIIYSDAAILYANRAALELAGLSSLQALKALRGIDALFASGFSDAYPSAHGPRSDGPTRASMVLVRPDGTHVPVAGRLQSVRWDGQPAALLSIRETGEPLTAPADEPAPVSVQIHDAPTADTTSGALPLVRSRIGELEAIVDLASDGVVTLDGDGEIKDLNQAAQALVGYTNGDLIGKPFRLLFPEDSRQIALDYLDDMAQSGRLSLFNEGRELECLTAQGGLVPVFMTLGRLTDDDPATFCAVLRDLSPFKQAETDLVAARKAAEEASAHKSEFLARVSHEIRTPLNAVIGFSEVMLEERFGPVGSERYRQYLRDIHTSGEHLMSLLNDLLDLSKIEAGKMELTFSDVDLNEVVQQCLAIMQPQASQGRIIVRTSLPLTLPKVVADLRSVRQVVLNLMSNAIKFTPPGGQIIVSTLYEPSGEVSLRVRDTGRGMDAADVALALEPFRQVPTTLNEVIAGTGLGLPLTKALAEANRAQFALESTPGEGTLAIVTFPSQRVLAE